MSPGSALDRKPDEIDTRQVYVSNGPTVFVFVVTRNNKTFESRLLDFLKEGGWTDYRFGFSFGKYDYIFEKQCTSSDDAELFLTNFRDKITKSGSSRFRGTLSVLIGYRMRRQKRQSRDQQVANPKFSVRSYCLTRLTAATPSELFDLIEKTRSDVGGIDLDLYWNPGIYSFVIKIDTNSFEAVAKFLYRMHENSISEHRGMSLSDTCSFVTVGYGSNSISEAIPLKAWVNIKIRDPNAIERILRLPKTRIRLGYYDVVKEVNTKSLWSVLKATRKLRRVAGDPTGYTATVLTYRKHDVTKSAQGK